MRNTVAKKIKKFVLIVYGDQPDHIIKSIYRRAKRNYTRNRIKL